MFSPQQSGPNHTTLKYPNTSTQKNRMFSPQIMPSNKTIDQEANKENSLSQLYQQFTQQKLQLSSQFADSDICQSFQSTFNLQSSFRKMGNFDSFHKLNKAVDETLISSRSSPKSSQMQFKVLFQNQNHRQQTNGTLNNFVKTTSGKINQSKTLIQTAQITQKSCIVSQFTANMPIKLLAQTSTFDIKEGMSSPNAINLQIIPSDSTLTTFLSTKRNSMSKSPNSKPTNNRQINQSLERKPQFLLQNDSSRVSGIVPDDDEVKLEEPKSMGEVLNRQTSSRNQTPKAISLYSTPTRKQNPFVNQGTSAYGKQSISQAPATTIGKNFQKMTENTFLQDTQLEIENDDDFYQSPISDEDQEDSSQHQISKLNFNSTYHASNRVTLSASRNKQFTSNLETTTSFNKTSCSTYYNNPQQTTKSVIKFQQSQYLSNNTLNQSKVQDYSSVNLTKQNELHDYVDNQVMAVSTLVQRKKDLEKQKQEHKYQISVRKEDIQTLNKQITANQIKFDKETKIFNENQSRIQEQMSDIQKIRSKIQNFYNNSENGLVKLASQRNELHEKLEIFLHEYQYQSQNEQEVLENEKIEIKQLQEVNGERNSELEDIQKTVKRLQKEMLQSAKELKFKNNIMNSVVLTKKMQSNQEIIRMTQSQNNQQQHQRKTLIKKVGNTLSQSKI